MRKLLRIKFLLIILIIIGLCVMFFEYNNRNNAVILYINNNSSLINDNNGNVFNDNYYLIENENVGEYNVNYEYEDVNNVNNADSYSETEVVNYFEVMNDEISESESFKDKFKEYFVTIVDFIFYDKDIKGYTFKELSNTAKIKVISFALKIDAKLEEYLPNYKENISTVSGAVYNNIKEKLVYLYMDISTNICKNNEEDCNYVKIIWSEIKDACGVGWEFIKNIVSDGIEKLKDWYEIYSGKR